MSATRDSPLTDEVLDTHVARWDKPEEKFVAVFNDLYGRCEATDDDKVGLQCLSCEWYVIADTLKEAKRLYDQDHVWSIVMLLMLREAHEETAGRKTATRQGAVHGENPETTNGAPAETGAPPRH